MVGRKTGQLGFADRMVTSPAGGNTVLEKVLRFVDWQKVEGLLGGVRSGTTGRPPYPSLMMFKALLLQRWYDLSDPALEEALKDRLSFRHFIGVGLTEALPDFSTLWRFRESLGPALSQKVFAEIGAQIVRAGFVLKQGTLIDASLVPASVNPPKKPDGPPDLDADGKPASKLVKSALDPDAGWTRKQNHYHFGYKLHVAMDKTSRIIRRLVLTPANVNESGPADSLICGDEVEVLADKAYDSKQRRLLLKQLGIANGIMRRGHPRRPLTWRDLKRNKQIGRQRGAIEPLFALYKNVYGFARARYRGLKRNSTSFVLAAICMNLKRVAILQAA